jgi:hypothetical protein
MMGELTLATRFHAGFLIGLFFDVEDGDGMLTLKELHGIIPQRAELFRI